MDEVKRFITDIFKRYDMGLITKTEALDKIAVVGLVNLADHTRKLEENLFKYIGWDINKL